MACLLSAPCCEVERAPGRDVSRCYTSGLGLTGWGSRRSYSDRLGARATTIHVRSFDSGVFRISEMRVQCRLGALVARPALARSPDAIVGRFWSAVALPVSGLVGDPHPTNENSK